LDHALYNAKQLRIPSVCVWQFEFSAWRGFRWSAIFRLDVVTCVYD